MSVECSSAKDRILICRPFPANSSDDEAKETPKATSGASAGNGPGNGAANKNKKQKVIQDKENRKGLNKVKDPLYGSILVQSSYPLIGRLCFIVLLLFHRPY